MGVYEIKHYVMGIIIFCLIILSGLGFIKTLVDNNPNNDLEQEKLQQFDILFNQSGSILSETNDLEKEVINASTDFGTFGVLNSLISTTWQGIKLTTRSFSFMKIAVYGPYYMFGIPLWVVELVYALILILIVYAIYDAIFGGSGR